MSRPVKLSDKDKSWNRPKQFCRPKAFRSERQRILIVCEGTKTEPNYFLSIKQKLVPNTVFLEIEGEGANTLSLVKRARDIRDSQNKSDYPFDQVWVVFDRDSFQPDAFNNAVSSAEADGMHCAWSNEAFELWYVLHFEFRNTSTARSDFEGIISRHLGERYEKNALNIYKKISCKGNEKQAISRAKRLLNDFQSRNIPPSQSNPCTTVFKLVEVLNKYLSQKKD